MSTTKTLLKNMALLSAMLAPDYDWKSHWEADKPDVEELCKKCVKPLSTTEKFYGCGSFEVKNTPAALYRALWLFRPTKVDFSDMYKTNLFAMVSSCGRFAFSVELYKYEIGIYLYTNNKDFVTDQGTGVIGGWPGCDNGWNCSDEQGQQFFSLIQKLLETKHMVYGGNDFEV